MQVDSRDFKALETLVVHMSGVVKGKIKEELKKAEMNARQMCENGEVRAEIAYTQRLVTGCEAYTAPVAKAAVKKSFEIVKEWEGGTVYEAGGQRRTVIKCQITLPMTPRVSTSCGATVGGSETILRT
jgi:hypothetical protein